MLLLLAALLPCVVWDGDASLPAKYGIDRLCTTEQAKGATKLPKPGVEYRMNEASASRSPWLDSNGWRILRASGGRFYYDVAGDGASTAAAEAYVYGADAMIHTDAKGLEALGKIMPFLKQVKPADLAPVANIGLIDDGTTETGELMNLLSRHNLLYQRVTVPDPRLNLNVKIGTAEYPKSEATNPNLLSHKIRANLTDEKRSLRLYGSEVVLGRLTGDRTHARLQLIDYDKRAVQGLRVRVLGEFPRHEVAIAGFPGAGLLDYSVTEGATEFTVKELSRLAVIDLYSDAASASNQWQVLFDGVSTKGWREITGKPFPNSWTVEDGCLKTLIRPDGAQDIRTEEEFHSFELEFEWKLAVDGNSGVKYLVQNVDEWTNAKGRQARARGFEYQLAGDREPDAASDERRYAGSLYSVLAPTPKVTPRADAFNQSRIIVKGNHLEHWLNGQRVVSTDLTAPDVQQALRKLLPKASEPSTPLRSAGPIALQNHGSECWFRNIRIRRLD